MPRCRLRLAITMAGIVAASSLAARAQDEPSPETKDALRFVRGLRERGYHDLALDYLEGLRQAADTPPELRVILDYEQGRGLLEEADVALDLDRRRELLEQARLKLDAFLKDHPDHQRVPEVLVQLARLFYQRGQTAVLQANDAATPAEKQAKLGEARASFDQARQAYAKAEEPLQAAFKAFPNFIPEGDPRKEAREQAHVALMDAELQRSVVDYEEAQTYPLGSPERPALLDKAVESFKDIYQRYRTMMAGLAARMWQGKCYEEKGDLGAALGIYNELLEHPAPQLQQIQRQVAFFKIIALGKRKEFALAADLARSWMEASQGDRGSYERLGVQLEYAKDLLAQLPDATEAERAAATRLATDVLSEVVRYASPFKTEAIDLLRQYKPKSTLNPKEVAQLNYENSMGQADQAMADQDWDRAIALLKNAVLKADPLKDIERANRARYNLAYCAFMAKRYYEAAAVAEFLARRYPKWELAIKATEIGMAALSYAYNTYNQVDPGSDLNNLIDLARYTAATWPQTDQADVAQVTMGDIFLGQGRYADAATAYEAVRPNSSRRLDAQVKAGTAHWRQSLVLLNKAGGAPPPGAETEAKTALDLLDAAYKARQEAKAPPSDPALLDNAAILAEIHLVQNRPEQALALIGPLVQAVGAINPRPQAVAQVYARLLTLMLRGHIASGQTDRAIDDMKALETANTGEPLTQLFFGLGRLLEREMEGLKAKGDQAGLQRTQQTYQKFLEALIGSQSGQSFDSLQWAGESMLSLGKPQEATAVFERILKAYPSDPKILRTKLKLAAARRANREFDKAWGELDLLIKANPRSLEQLVERCQLLEDWALAEPGRWGTAISYWRQLALLLGNAKPRPPEYYQAWWHVAFCQSQGGDPAAAKRTLKSVLTLSSQVVTAQYPEIKKKYDDLLVQLGG
jgi:tetratricopeptide (TPR) repeat protein